MKPKITDFSQLDLTKTYTYADYLTWRFNERVELIKGWIHKMSPAPRPLHQEVETALSSELYTFFKKNKACKVYNSPFDVRLLINKGQKDKEITTVFQPDICVVCDPSKIDNRGCVGAPDLIVEVLSISTMKKDYNEKFNLYEENGVKEYWLVNPEMKAIQIFSLENGVYQEFDTLEEKEEIVTSKLFPELKFPMNEVFEY
jgi:Uma2 family endonuclease